MLCHVYSYQGAQSSQAAARSACTALGSGWDLVSFSSAAEANDASSAGGACGGFNSQHQEQWVGLIDAGVGGSYNPGVASGGRTTYAGWAFTNGASTAFLYSAAGQALWEAGQPVQDSNQLCASYHNGLKNTACSWSGLGACCIRVVCPLSTTPSPTTTPTATPSHSQSATASPSRS